MYKFIIVKLKNMKVEERWRKGLGKVSAYAVLDSGATRLQWDMAMLRLKAMQDT